MLRPGAGQARHHTGSHSPIAVVDGTGIRFGRRLGVGERSRRNDRLGFARVVVRHGGRHDGGAVEDRDLTGGAAAPPLESTTLTVAA